MARGTMRVPRTRGDEPIRSSSAVMSTEFPAHAGMNHNLKPPYVAILRVPRTRGDEPPRQVAATAVTLSSPHTRG